MSILKRIIAWIMIFATTVFVFCVPAFADSNSDSGYSQTAGFWHWLAGKGSILNGLIGYTTGAVCAESGDGYHHANSYEIARDDGYYKCICTYCGKSFVAYESDLKKSYDDQVSALPFTNINSQGLASFYLTGWTYEPDSSSITILSSLPDYPCVYAEGLIGVTVVWATSGTFSVPVSGSYAIVFPEPEVSAISSVYCQGETTLSGGAYDKYSLGNCDEGFARNVILAAGVQYSITAYLCAAHVDSFSFYRIYRPYIQGALAGSSGNQYNINSRPTSITGGNYGIIGDNGKIITVNNNNQIINETNNTYYNPATGQTYTITDWSYDYKNRVYNITLSTGDKVSVKYGDQNITIKQNNITYIVYYIIGGSTPDPVPTESPTPPIDGCLHDWRESSRTAPGCTSPGEAVYTCSKCGDTKSEILKVLGHDWKVLRTVLTEYDEDGNQTQAGYTIYECTRYGEQYKDTASNGPPAPSPGTDDGGLLEFLNGIIKYLSDNLSGAVELIRRFFSEIPKLFDGFTGFLAAVFPFLPDEIMLLLTFGMAALVFVGVIKAIRR